MPTPSKGQRARAARHADDQEPAADVHGELLSIETLDIPEPSAIKAVWFPAIIQVPGEEPRYKGKAYATPEGLYVYWSVPAPSGEPGVENWTPDWWSPIDYERTGRPPTGWAARNGFFIYTDAGKVTITMETGCGCHMAIKRWTPSFATRNVAW